MTATPSSESYEYDFSLSSPIAIVVYALMILYWLISAGILVAIRYVEKRSSRNRSLSDHSAIGGFYDQGMSRNKVQAVAHGV